MDEKCFSVEEIGKPQAGFVGHDFRLNIKEALISKYNQAERLCSFKYMESVSWESKRTEGS